MKLGTETAGIKVWIGRVCNVSATSSVLVNDPSEPDTDIISIGSYHRSVWWWWWWWWCFHGDDDDFVNTFINYQRLMSACHQSVRPSVCLSVTLSAWRHVGRWLCSVSVVAQLYVTLLARCHRAAPPTETAALAMQRQNDAVCRRVAQRYGRNIR